MPDYDALTEQDDWARETYLADLADGMNDSADPADDVCWLEAVALRRETLQYELIPTEHVDF